MKRLLLLIILIILFNCSKNKRTTELINLPETKNSIDIYQWGVIKYDKPRLRLEPKEDSEVINYLPIGSVIKIIKKNPDILLFNNQKDYWYYVDYDGEKGWLFGTFFEIYNNYDEVVKRCEEIIIEYNKNKDKKIVE